MKQYMNEPVEYNWSDKDVIAEYERSQDKRKVAKIFCITVKQVNDILKMNGK